MKKIIYTADAPEPIGPYSQAVMAGDTLYISGQIALDAHSGELILGDIQEETSRVMENLGKVLQAAGMDFRNLVKCSIFIRDMAMFNAVNEIYTRYFDEYPPARETVAVAGLPKNVNVEISGIARKED